jgi:penicillin-insensitive murein endopeptidase
VFREARRTGDDRFAFTAAVSAALAGTACLGTPTPLAPQLEGSIGLPHFGVQTKSVELPTAGPGFERYRPFGSAYFGQPELVAEVQRVALDMQRRFRGPPLVLGDLSAEAGGQIPRHNSHRSGRDVDLLWFVTTPVGVPFKSPGFIRLGPDGIAIDPDSGKYYRLDVERQWEAIKAFLTSDRVHVQWMFMSRPIEAILIQYARARGEPDGLVWQAETVMLQPQGSLPHDDHIHLRISCTPDTMITGCAGGGPYWEWLPALEAVDIDGDFLERLGREDPLVPSPMEAEQATASG